MAKFNYKKWVTENKYGKLNEQAGSALVALRACNGSLTQTGCLPNASNYSLGHQFKFQTFQGTRAGFLQSIINPSCPSGFNDLNIIEDPYVGACANNNITPNVSTPTTGLGTTTTPTGSATGSGCFYCDPYAYAQTQQLAPYPNATPTGLMGSCQPNQVSGISDPQGIFGANMFSPVIPLGSPMYNYLSQMCATSASLITPTGGPTPAGTGSFDDYGIGGGTQFSYPNNWSVTGWTNNFVDMMLAHPNPCNFLNQRYNQFGNQLQQGGMGPLQTNLVYQKFAVVHTLLELTGCGLPSPNPFTSLLQEQINEIKLDPAAKQILQKREKEIRGLSRKKERGKRRKRRRNENKINTLKRIIKETLSELQEKQKACSCRNGVCKTAGGNLCPSHECDGACKGSENTVDRKNK